MQGSQTLERFELRLSGLGGQGVLTLGRIMGQSLALEHGYQVAQTQSYGPEARGGASRCDLIVSSYHISYPKTLNLDLLLALSQEACSKYCAHLKAEGFLVVDTTLVTQTPSNIFWGLPFTQLAQEVGLTQTTNIVALGALTHFLPFMNASKVRKTLKEILPQKIVEINLKAFDSGLNRAKKEYSSTGQKWKSY